MLIKCWRAVEDSRSHCYIEAKIPQCLLDLVTVSLFPALSFNQFDGRTEPFISLLPGDGKEDKMQYCRAKSGFIHIVLIFNDGERRKRIRRERFKVNLIGNI